MEGFIVVTHRETGKAVSIMKGETASGQLTWLLIHSFENIEELTHSELVANYEGGPATLISLGGK